MVLPAGQSTPADGDRLVFPSDQTVFRPGAPGTAMRNATGREATVYADSLGSVLADIQSLDGTPIEGSVLTIDAYSRLPLFLGPEGRDTVFVQVDSGPIVPVYARADDRLDAHDALLVAIDSRIDDHDDQLMQINGQTGNLRSVWLNVLDYGAVGDNVADDRPAIQAAIAACPQGGTVYLPPGYRFRIGGTLNITAGVTLRGGWNPRQPRRTNMVSSYVRPATGGTFVGTALISVNPVSSSSGSVTDSAYNGGPRLVGLALSGLTSTNSTGAAIDGVQCQPGVKDLVIDGVTAWQFSGNGFALADAQNVLLDRAVAAYNLGHGITFTAATEVEMTNTVAYGNTGDGIRLPDPTMVTLIAVQSDRNGMSGFRVYGTCNGLQFVGCTTDRNAYDGYLLAHNAGRAVTLTGCTAKRDGLNDNINPAGFAGIRVAPSGGVTGPGAHLVNCMVFVGNDDDGTGLRGPDYGLMCDTGASRVTVVGGSYLGTVAAIQDPSYYVAKGSGVTKGTVVRADGTTTLAGADEVQITGPAGSSRTVDFLTRGGGLRWSLAGATNDPESGSNAGSHFGLARMADNGSFIDYPLTVFRDSGATRANSLYTSGSGGLAGIGPTPANHGLTAWTTDPAMVNNYVAPTGGLVYLVAMWLPRSMSITKLLWGYGAVAVTPTSGQNWVGLYNAAGTRLVSVDVTAKTTNGTFMQTETFAGVSLAPGMYWAAFLFNAATLPKIFVTGNIYATLSNVGISSVSQYRAATGPSGQTSLPATINPASLAVSASVYFAAIG